MKKKWNIVLLSWIELDSKRMHYILHNTKLLSFEYKNKQLFLWDLNNKQVYKIFWCSDELIQRFYPTYHTIIHDLEQLRIEDKAEACLFEVERELVNS